MTWLEAQNPILQALLATCFTWFVTAAGAALVFVFKTINRKIFDGMLGFAATVHGAIANNIWGLDWYAWSSDPDVSALIYPCD